MKILFVSQYFYPEIFRGNDIAFDLVERGHEVTVITGVPNYPQGKFFEGYSLFKRNNEIVNGVKVFRIPLFPRGNGNSISLLLNYFSYAIFGSVFSFFYSLFNKFDLIFVQQLSPVLMSLPAIIVKKKQNIPMYLWVLDLWPESLISAGGYKNKYLIAFFDFFVKLQYRNSKKILVSSKGFIDLILKKGEKPDKIIYFPNWAESVFDTVERKEIPTPPDGFIVMFAGNIGECQDFDNVMKATKELSDEKEIHFIILGEGRKKEFAENFATENNLSQTVHFLGRYPLEFMPSFFESASIMLISLKSDLVFNATAPAKLQAYMATGKPIVGMLSGDGSDIIEEANCGLAVTASDYVGLAKAIKVMKSMSNKDREQFGTNGKNFSNKNFKKKTCLENLSNIINDL